MHFQKKISLTKELIYLIQKYNEAKFSFERSIVFDPKHANSYLYLAKIYKEQEDQKMKKKFRNNIINWSYKWRSNFNVNGNRDRKRIILK